MCWPFRYFFSLCRSQRVEVTDYLTLSPKKGGVRVGAHPSPPLKSNFFRNNEDLFVIFSPCGGFLLRFSLYAHHYTFRGYRLCCPPPRKTGGGGRVGADPLPSENQKKYIFLLYMGYLIFTIFSLCGGFFAMFFSIYTAQRIELQIIL